MAAKHESRDSLHRDVEFVGKEITEARRVEHARHADHFMLRQAATFLQRPHHGIQWIGDADHEGVGCVFFYSRTDLAHHFQIDVQQIVPAHARLTRHAGGNDADVGAPDSVIAVGYDKFCIETIDLRQLRDIDSLALGNALHNVEQHDVAEFL